MLLLFGMLVVVGFDPNATNIVCINLPCLNFEYQMNFQFPGQFLCNARDSCKYNVGAKQFAQNSSFAPINEILNLTVIKISFQKEAFPDAKKKEKQKNYVN